MRYPPFTTLFLINLSSKHENKLIKKAQSIGIILKNKLSSYNDLNILGPCPSPLSKIKEKYRWQIVIKGNINYHIAENIKKMVYSLLEHVYNDIRVSMDINPNSLL